MEANRRYLRRTQPELVAALYYPHAPPDVLTLIAQWTAFAFILDDEFDDGPADSQPVFSAHAIDKMTGIMQAATPTNPLGDALLDLWTRLRAERSASWCTAFRTDVGRWLWTYYAETVERASDCLPSIDDYQLLRIDSVGMPMYLDMCELAHGIDLPDPVRQLPAWRTLRAAACQRIGLYNDLLSARKERMSGYSHNAVFLLENNGKHTTRQAVDYVNSLVTIKIKKMNAAEEQALRQIAVLDSDNLLTNGQRCLTAYRDLVRGDRDYHFLTQRYSDPEKNQITGAEHVADLLGAHTYLTSEQHRNRP